MPRLDTGSRFAKSGKRKAGFTSVVAVVILLGLVAVMGSVALIWGNNFNFEKQKLGDYYVTNANKIKERIIIEDVWLSTNPGYTGVVVIRNVGDIGIRVSEVRINVLNSTGGAACTQSCETGTSASNAVKAPFTPDSTSGLISSQQSLMVAVDKIHWNHTNSKDLEVFVTTERGSIIWRVYDWKTSVATVKTCNGYPVTISGTDSNEDLVGTSGDDVIHAFGNGPGTFDTISGMGGNDVICGGDGQDNILGGDGDDKIYSGNDNDTVSGNNGNDTIDGGDGNDTLNGNDGNDTIDGGNGSDTINGGNDNDSCKNGETVSFCES